MSLYTGNHEKDLHNLANVMQQYSTWDMDKWEDLLRIIFDEPNIKNKQENLYIANNCRPFLVALSKKYGLGNAQIRLYPIAVAIGLYYEITKQFDEQGDDNFPISLQESGYEPDEDGEYNSVIIIQDAAQKGLEILAGSKANLKEPQEVKINSIDWLSYLE